MIFQSWLANILGIISGFMAIGAFLDTVASTDSTKVKIVNFVKKKTKQTGPSSTFFELIDATYESIFARLFRGPFLSLGYFLKCASLSLFMLSLYSLLEFIFYPEYFTALKLSNAYQLTLIIVAIIANLVIDWISLGQTQVFFLVAKSLDKMSHALVLIAADLVLTINLFTMLFAQIIGYLLLLAYSSSGEYKAQAEVTLYDSSHLAEEINAGTYDVLGAKIFHPFFRIQYLVQVNAKDSDLHFSAPLNIFSDSADIRLLNVLQLKGLLNTEDAVGTTTSEVSRDPSDDRTPIKYSNLTRNSKLWRLLSSYSEFTETEKVSFKLPWFGVPFDRVMSYTVAYKAIDSVQDGFPQTLNFLPNEIRASDLIREYSPLVFPELIVGCLEDVGSNQIWKLSSFADLNKANCSKRFIVEGSRLGDFISSLKETNEKIYSTRLPLNPFFFTSISVTVLLYFSMFLMFFARKTQAIFYLGLGRLETAFQKAPLTTISFFAGSAFALISSVWLIN
jgi:hypothetical protein